MDPEVLGHHGYQGFLLVQKVQEVQVDLALLEVQTVQVYPEIQGFQPHHVVLVALVDLVVLELLGFQLVQRVLLMQKK